VIIAAAVNCTITEKKYKVLKIFFDGVPDPNAPKEPSAAPQEQLPGQKGKPGQQDVVIIESSHPDFNSRNCEKCHNKSVSNFLKAPREKFCFTCHDKNDFQGEYLHGPVAASGCLACHLPHRSQHKYLLKETDAKMCLVCHMREDVALNPVHAGVDFEKGKCTQCHYPHAAASRFFLKTG
jgi:predicted CXXCH cytochrome family protein